MAKKVGKFSVERSAQAFQENVRRSASAARASYTLIGAIVLLGGVGYALDEWRGTSPWFLMSGLILGMLAGFYDLMKTIWHR